MEARIKRMEARISCSPGKLCSGKLRDSSQMSNGTQKMRLIVMEFGRFIRAYMEQSRGRKSGLASIMHQRGYTCPRGRSILGTKVRPFSEISEIEEDGLVLSPAIQEWSTTLSSTVRSLTPSKGKKSINTVPAADVARSCPQSSSTGGRLRTRMIP